jgi:L-fuculose-phosphate aldolase
MAVEQQAREEMVRLGRTLHQKNYIVATDGNLTARLDPGRVLATPAGICKGFLDPGDLVVVDMQGQKLAGHRVPSSEIAMHLLIYRLRPDVQGIVHAHPVTATGYAAAGVELNQALLSEAVACLGAVPLAPYATPGTAELAASIAPLVPHHDAILMANHGVVTYSDSLFDAYLKMERVEHFAKIALVTHLLGKQHPLSESEVEKLGGRLNQ